VDIDAGTPLQYGQSTSLQADTSGPPPTYTQEAYGWLELMKINQMIDSYLFETTVVKEHKVPRTAPRFSGPVFWDAYTILGLGVHLATTCTK